MSTRLTGGKSFIYFYTLNLILRLLFLFWCHQVDNKTTIAFIKNQDERLVQQLYKSLKPKFINWLRGQYGMKDLAAQDEIYQRSFTVLYFNIKRDKIVDLNARIETYLFGIGKMVVKEWWREQSKNATDLQNTDEPILSEIDLFGNVFAPSAIDETLRLQLTKAMSLLGEPCQSILRLYYWDENSMEAIALKTGYKNELGAKKKKYLCLMKLKELMGK